MAWVPGLRGQTPEASLCEHRRHEHRNTSRGRGVRVRGRNTVNRPATHRAPQGARPSSGLCGPERPLGGPRLTLRACPQGVVKGKKAQHP